MAVSIQGPVQAPAAGKEPGQTTPKNEAPLPPGAIAPGTTPAPLPPGTLNAKPSAPPPAAPQDGIDRTPRHGQVDAKESASEKPFGSYTLPESECSIPKQSADVTEAMHAGLATAVTDVVKALVDPTAVQWVQDRAQYLSATPGASLFLEVLGPTAPQQLAEGLTASIGAALSGGGLDVKFGEGAERLVTAARTSAFEVLLGEGVLGKAMPFEQLQSRFAQMATEGKGLAPALDGVVFDAAGKPKPEALAQVAATSIAVLEASLEYVIGAAGQLLKGDLGEDLDQLAATLEDLKAEKKAIIGKIVEKEGSILGQQASMADAVKRANEANECAKIMGAIFPVVLLVVTIVIAVVVTVFSFGTAGPAALIAVLGVSKATAGVLCTVLAVAAIAGAVITTIQTMPAILQTVAVVLRACGLEGAAETLEKAAEELQTFLADSILGDILGVASIACALTQAAIMAPMAFAKVADSALRSTLQLVAFLQAGRAVIGGIQAVATSAVMKDLAEINREMDMLREQLAQIELEIKALFQQMEEKKADEEAINEDISAIQDMEGRIMENVNKAAESYKAILNAVQL